MANNKFYGYNPKKDEITTGWETGWKQGNRLDQVNPYEFRKGMDYEFTAMGVQRLQESTPEEREKATENVLKNLEKHNGYYTSLITYETTFRNVKSKPSFTSWLKEQDEFKMKEVNQKYKGDKMTEPKTKSHEESTKAHIKMKALKEAIKNEIKKSILEKKMKEQEDDIAFDDDDKAADKAATKAAKRAKKSNRFDLEREAIKDLLYRGKKGKDSEYTKEDPAPKSILDVKNEMLDLYKTKYKGEEGGVEAYNEELIKANEKFEKLLEKHVEKFGEGEKGLGNKVDMKIVYGEKLPDTIKLLGARLKDLEKEEEGDVLAKEAIRRTVAETDMTREQHIKLLEIIKDKGISLREGTDMVRPYYEIAKSAYLEGLANGMKL